jgi:peptidoglycan/LPS O-acetylase OafA/YrhL
LSDTDSKIRAPHLYEVDVVRILTFACVIAVHTTSDTIGATDVPLFAVLGILHFTREVFFALSGFVLVYSYLGRPVPMRQFWPRRFLLAGVPYLLWSAIYLFAGTLHAPHLTPLELIGRFIVVVLTGSAWYHLYFLLVTMQVYLLLPAIMWTVKKSRGRHGLVLAVGGVFQLLLMAVYEYWSDMPGWLSAGIQSFFFS